MLNKWLIMLALKAISKCHKPIPILWHRLTDIFTALNAVLGSCIHCLMEEENANSVRRNLRLDFRSIDSLKP